MKRKDNSLHNNPMYDHVNYHFMNVVTGIILYCNRTTFRALYSELRKAGISEMINKGITYKNWCVLYSL